MNIVPESPRALATTAALSAALIGAALGGCAKETKKAETPSGSSVQIIVDATDTACTLSVTETGKGKRTFVVTNNGTKVTEFYVYGRNNEVLGEAENISPGLQRTSTWSSPRPAHTRPHASPAWWETGSAHR